MRVFSLLLLHVILLATPSNESCNYCHVDVITLSATQSKDNWLQLTQDDNDTLKTIHHKNLDVVFYLNSSEYNASQLYEDMEFFAPYEQISKEKKRYKDIQSRCSECHFSEPRLAKLWQDREWETLLKSSDKLREAHKNNLAVLEYIDSKDYKKNLSKFIKSMKFFALNIIKVTLKDENTTFIFEADDANIKEAEYLFNQIKKELKRCKIEDEIFLHVSSRKKSASFFNSLLSVSTLFVPVYTKTFWSMRVRYKNREFLAHLEVENSVTIVNRFDKEFEFDKMDTLFKQINIPCSKARE